MVQTLRCDGSSGHGPATQLHAGEGVESGNVMHWMHSMLCIKVLVCMYLSVHSNTIALMIPGDLYISMIDLCRTRTRRTEGHDIDYTRAGIYIPPCGLLPIDTYASYAPSSGKTCKVYDHQRHNASYSVENYRLNRSFRPSQSIAIETGSSSVCPRVSSTISANGSMYVFQGASATRDSASRLSMPRK